MLNFEKYIKMNFEKQMKILELIETFELKEFKVTDVIHNDLYRHMSNAGLFDYDYIERGQISSKGTKRKASKTNMVFLVWLMIARDLKDFGIVNSKLHMVKDYLFKEFDLLDNVRFEPTKENFYNLIDWTNITDETIKTELKESLKSGKFFDKIKDKKVSRVFYILFKLLYTKSDIKLYVKSNGEALFVDESEVSKEDLHGLTYVKSIILPLKNYLIYLIGEYASVGFLTHSQILSENEAKLLSEFRRNDIVSLTVKYHNKKPNTYETKTHTKVHMQNKLADVLSSSNYEDVTVKTKKGRIYYVELTRKELLNK